MLTGGRLGDSRAACGIGAPGTSTANRQEKDRPADAGRSVRLQISQASVGIAGPHRPSVGGHPVPSRRPAG